MLHFFHLIRRKLIEEKNMRKYLLYSLGEILLVMIGILLALQVNTWSQNVNNKKEEAFYYEKLKENLRQDTTNINTSLVQINRVVGTVDQIIEEFETKDSETLEGDIAYALIAVVSFTPETSTWENLKSTGKINIITQQAVIDSLTSYHNIYTNSTKQWIDANKEYARNHLGPYLMSFDDIRLDFSSEESGQYFDVFESQTRSVRDYRNDVFIRNALKFKLTNMTGLEDLLLQDFDRAVRTLELLNRIN